MLALQCCVEPINKQIIIFFSSQEPDAKRQRVDDGSAAATALTDAQAQNSAYNYNWYQVLVSSSHKQKIFVL